MRAIVRIYTLEAAEMDLKWIFMLIKAYIPKAVAVKVLCNGNIEVIFLN